MLFFGVIAKLGLKCEMRGNGTRSYVPEISKYVLARQYKLPQSFLSFLSCCLPLPHELLTPVVLAYECVRSPPGHLHSATGEPVILTLLMTSTETIIRVNFFGAIVIRVIVSSE